MSMREHGTYAKYKLDGCRCQPYVDAEPVREHVRTLAEFGIGWMRLARIANVPRGTVSKLLYGDSNRGMGPSKRILPKNAAALLAVEPTLDNLADRAAVDGAGTRRRLQALVAAGWPQTRIAARIGISNFTKTMHGDQPVRVTTARAAVALYDELWRADPRDHGVRPHVYERTRRQARDLRWAPVGAWDDDTIDDPAAFPDWTGRCGTPQGFRAHYQLGIPTCQPCLQARAEHRTAARAVAA
ncbi:hypothetical protein [Streptomyces sp. B1I3]|uniref:hypothetical protein n=1 Tax=Streptomyces sp. B1I3 TaxID=3042264 RepID=UPI002785E6EE|nr:hypothetical protein [Streptomyces sp. B1I3]MDQ0792042.1 hypothetical protein [Streptomyces sp. B1I3]